MGDVFRVGITRDFLRPDGSLGFGDIGLDMLATNPQLEWEFLAEDTPELRADQVRGYDALLVLAPRVSAATLDGVDHMRLVARFGVGYDTIDVEACTRQGVLLTITPDGVRRPMASSILALILALAHQIIPKDRLTRAGRWSDRVDYMGVGLTGRTLGVIGAGNIGREVFTLTAPLGMRHLAYDPYLAPEQATGGGFELVDFETLLRTADFISICCALTPETHQLINADRLAMMKPEAFLINTARGPIVDQSALTEALRAHRIQGAAIDVFETEPIDPNDPILQLDNVILTPHAVTWTDECFRGIGRSACQSILDVAAGKQPKYLVNRAALEHPRVQARLVAR